MKPFSSIAKFFKKLFASSMSFARSHSAFIAVRVTNALKKVVEGPYDNYAAELIPGELPKHIVALLEKWIPIIAEQMAVTYQIIQLNPKDGDAVRALILHLRSLTKAERAKYWKDLSARVNMHISQSGKSYKEAYIESQIEYFNNFKEIE